MNEETKIVEQEETSELEQDLSSSEQFIQLEIEKELARMEKEVGFKNISELATCKEFNKGMSEALELVGFYTTFLNFGVSQKTAEDLMVNKHTYDYNTKLQKIINANQLEVAKVQELKIQQGQTL